ncbi:MAG: transglutaminase domain-containing protein [Nitrospirae bacterium]|nr:transglutaminase domain-containing protein [Nitrospirota bacterium]
MPGLPELHISRRAFIAGALATAGALLAKRPDSVGEPLALPGESDTRIEALTYKIRYLTEFYTADQAVRVWIPLPAVDPNQEITNLAIESRYPYTVNRASDNSAVYIEADGTQKGTCASVRFTMRRKTTRITEAKDIDVARYLKLSEWEKWDEAIVKFIDMVVGGETDPVRIGKRIYDAVVAHTAYVHQVCSRGVSVLAFEDKSGRSDDFHAMFRTMLVYKAIPVKWEQGVLLPYHPTLNKKGTVEADCINSHSWLRFYAGGKTIPVDLAEGKRWPGLREFCFGGLTANRIKFSTGRGLTLNPPQSEILNTFSYTHAEADGVPMTYGHNYRTFIKYELLRKEV